MLLNSGYNSTMKTANKERCISCHNGTWRLLFKAISVAAVLTFAWTDVSALSVQHHGIVPSRPCTRLASSTSSHLDISVIVDTSVTVSSTYSDGAAATLSTSSSSASSSTASLSTPATEISHGTDTDASTVPMDTPARQSLPSHLRLRPMQGKGMGVISLKHISNGEFVGEYNGELMTEEVKDRRYLSSLNHLQTDEDRQWIQSRLERGQTLTGCYVYGISLPPNYKGNGLPESRIYVDAEDEYESLWTRFFNHASPPYNNVNPKSIHESYDGNPRVWFVANRDIEEGEEICFDYGDDYWLEGDDVV
mmetsp:Transcript_29306/g.62296  ORF Transcript_29306/g.62296 Transcript_29306/m.62296 type:complete len:307 (-) Transcript_29306:237-1157(-)